MAHRATFYTQFIDKYELLRSVLNDVQADLLQIQTNKDWDAESGHFLLGFVDYVVAHRSLFTLLLVEKDAHSLTALMRHQFATMTEAQVKAFQASGVRYSVLAPVMAQFFVGALFSGSLPGGWRMTSLSRRSNSPST
jgi:AcrR family transcriptional regulator